MAHNLFPEQFCFILSTAIVFSGKNIIPEAWHPSCLDYIMHAKLWLREGLKGVKRGQNGVCDGLILKITSGIVSTGMVKKPYQTHPSWLY